MGVRLTALAASIVALVATLGAAANFNASGAGRGVASVGGAKSVAVDAGTDPAIPLFPGTAGDVTARVTNPNGESVHVASLELDSTQGDGGFASDRVGCDVSALTFSTETNEGYGWDVPAGGAIDLELDGAVLMSTAASSGCQGASFAVYLRVG